MRRLLFPATIALAAAALSACGSTSGSTTSSASLPPVQYENGQRIAGYIQAVNKINAPFNHPATEPLNYAKGVQLLRTAVAELGALTPPPQFQALQAKLVKGFHGELAVFTGLEAAKRTHNAVALSNAESRNVASGEVTRAALAEMVTVLHGCEQDKYTC
jgi:hypothetical protein